VLRNNRISQDRCRRGDVFDAAELRGVVAGCRLCWRRRSSPSARAGRGCGIVQRAADVLDTRRPTASTARRSPGPACIAGWSSVIATHNRISPALGGLHDVLRDPFVALASSALSGERTSIVKSTALGNDVIAFGRSRPAERSPPSAATWSFAIASTWMMIGAAAASASLRVRMDVRAGVIRDNRGRRPDMPTAGDGADDRDGRSQVPQIGALLDVDFDQARYAERLKRSRGRSSERTPCSRPASSNCARICFAPSPARPQSAHRPTRACRACRGRRSCLLPRRR